MLKPHGTCLQCKFQLNQTTYLEKNVATDERYIWRNMGLKLQNTIFNILCRMAFLNKQVAEQDYML